VHQGTRASIKPRVRNYADWSPVSEIETRTEALAFHGFTETIRGNIPPGRSFDPSSERHVNNLIDHSIW
jgi:hypothetical protein